MENVLDNLIKELSNYYDDIWNKNPFKEENLIECDFTYELEKRLKELGIEYTPSKIDFLSKHLLYFYNYDKVCLLMTKKFLESPNTGRVSNDKVFSFCEGLIGADDEKLKETEDSFYMDAGDFSLEEKGTIISNIERNTILESIYGVNKIIIRSCNRHDEFLSCLIGTVEALELKRLGITEYHKKLFGQVKKDGHPYIKKA